MKITNSYGLEIDFNAAVNLMDCDIREELTYKMAPCSDQEFFDAYCKAHAEVFGEEFELSKPNPIW